MRVWIALIRLALLGTFPQGVGACGCLFAGKKNGCPCSDSRLGGSLYFYFCFLSLISPLIFHVFPTY